MVGKAGSSWEKGFPAVRENRYCTLPSLPYRRPERPKMGAKTRRRPERAFYSEVAERAACSYSPVSTRIRRASSPISAFSSPLGEMLLVRHCSRISR